jgi:hypothetical protein
MNMAQKIQHARLRMGSFNALDGERVARELEEHEELWDSFVFGRFGPGDLIELRDLPGGHINADTLYILTTTDRVPALERLYEHWVADTVHVSRGQRGSRGPRDMSARMGAQLAENQAVIELWWD